MAIHTANHDDLSLHDHAGARWLAPFMTLLILTLVGLAFMLLYPYIGG